MKSLSPYLLCEDASQYDLWLKLILGATLALTFILGIVLLPVDIAGAWVCLGVTAFDGLLFHSILPRRLQIFDDRLKIVLGYPFALNIPLSTIKEAKEAPARKAFIYWGVRFATSLESVVEIVRYRGLNILVSPRHQEAFLENLNQAVKNYHLDRTSLQKS